MDELRRAEPLSLLISAWTKQTLAAPQPKRSQSFGLAVLEIKAVLDRATSLEVFHEIGGTSN
tara:strand:+ start:289 stop:474 length:186 start_codon:yes stop_codon:yes gene_type:complete